MHRRGGASDKVASALEFMLFAPVKVMRMTAVPLSIPWMVQNPQRDVLGRIIYSYEGVGYKDPRFVGQSLRHAKKTAAQTFHMAQDIFLATIFPEGGIVNKLTGKKYDSKIFEKWRQAFYLIGGGMGTQSQAEVSMATKNPEKMLEELGKKPNKFLSLRTALQFATTLEHLTRVAELKSRADAAGITIEEILESNIDQHKLAELGFHSKEAAINFLRMGAGSYLKSIALSKGFFNTQIQSLDQARRRGLFGKAGMRMFGESSSKEAKKRNAAIMQRTVAVGLSTITAPTMIYWLVSHDHDEWKERATWFKNANWVVYPKAFTNYYRKVATALGLEDTWVLDNDAFKMLDAMPDDFYFFIRKHWEYGVMFGSVFERGMEGMMGEGFDVGSLTEVLFGSLFAPKTMFLASFAPTAMGPWLEYGLNRDFFTGRPIITPSEEARERRTQYTPRTPKSAVEVTGLYNDMIEAGGEYAASAMHTLLTLADADNATGAALATRDFIERGQLSPKQIDNVLNDYFTQTYRMLESVYRPASGIMANAFFGEELVSPASADTVPGLGIGVDKMPFSAFLGRGDRRGGSKTINEFWDLYRPIQEDMKTYKDRLKNDPSGEDAHLYYIGHQDSIYFHPYFTKVARKLRDLRDAAIATEGLPDKEMSPDEKRVQLAEMRERARQWAADAVELTGEKTPWQNIIRDMDAIRNSESE